MNHIAGGYGFSTDCQNSYVCGLGPFQTLAPIFRKRDSHKQLIFNKMLKCIASETNLFANNISRNAT